MRDITALCDAVEAARAAAQRYADGGMSMSAMAQRDTPEQKQALCDLIDAINKAIKSKAWTEALEKNSWTPAVLTGDAFTDFVDRDFASLRATMVKSGMI